MMMTQSERVAMRACANAWMSSALVLAAACSDRPNSGDADASTNEPPTASVRAPALVPVGEVVAASGVESSDPDGDALSYRWTLAVPAGGYPVSLDTTSETGVASFRPFFAGDYEIALVVDDGRLESEQATAVVTVAEPPVASSGGDQLVDVSDVVALDGTESRSPDGKPLTFAWEVVFVEDGSPVTLSDASAVSPTFTAERAGLYRASLVVDDGDLESSTDASNVIAAGGAVTAVSTEGATVADAGMTAVWSGSEVLHFGGVDTVEYQDPGPGHRYDPATDEWSTVSWLNAPIGHLGHSAVWTGSEMIVWGGIGGIASERQDTGARYDPVTDRWTPVSTVNAPSARSSHVGVWTGSRMLVWGGAEGVGDDLTSLDTGGSYDPESDSWTALSTVDAPEARVFHQGFWTGDRMLVWGGYVEAGNTPTGGLYDPTTDLWSATSVDGAPEMNYMARWVGSKLMVFDGIRERALYDPADDVWSRTALQPADWPTSVADANIANAVWTGEEMIGVGTYVDILGGGPSPPRARAYRPSTDEWTRVLSATGLPDDRWYAVAVWTDGAVFLWGGTGPGPRKDGFLLTP